jgi:hypothetical protein
VAQGVSVRWLTWAAASPKGDAADYDGDTEGVRALIDAAPALPASDVGGDEASQNDSAAPKGSGAAERMLRFRTAREIAQETPGAVPWAVSGLLAFGAVTELAGKIKLSGKTTFGTQLAAAIVQGRPFLSQPTARSPVVWLTEQPPASFREALRRADLLDRDDFIVLSHHDTIGTAWPTVVAAAVAEANRRGARVLVVDTLPQFAGIRGDSENASGDALGAIEPLLAAAGQHGLAVLVIRHERKSGGDVGEATRGSTAFGGAVDILLLLRRVDGAPSKTFRVLQGIGRFDETPEELMIELTETGYVPRGSRDEVKRQVLREAVLGALPESGDSGLRPTEADILKRLGEGFHRTGVQAALKSLVAAGVVQRTGAGKKNDPYRYHRAESGEPPASDPEGSEPPPCPPAPEIHSAGQEPLGRQQQSPRLSSPEERPELDASNDLLATLRDSLAPDERYRLEAERADGFPAATFVLGAVAKDAR